MLVHLIQHIIMFAPTWVESYVDRKGDPHSDYNDVFVRAVMIAIAGGLVAAWRVYQLHADPDKFVFFWVECSFMSFMYFCGSFQYLVNWYERDLTKKNWKQHLNETSIPDRWEWYSHMNWRLRMALHGSIIVAGWLYYYL